MTAPTHPRPAPTTPPASRAALRAGSRDTVPVLLSLMPLAVVIGVAARHAGVDLAAAWSASFLLCAGTAQLTIIELLGAGSAPLVTLRYFGPDTNPQAPNIGDHKKRQ